MVVPVNIGTDSFHINIKHVILINRGKPILNIAFVGCLPQKLDYFERGIKSAFVLDA